MATPLSQLQKGASLLVEAGEMIPADGEVVGGRATIEELAITGESTPAHK